MIIDYILAEAHGVKIWYVSSHQNLEIRLYPESGYEVWKDESPDVFGGDILSGPFDSFKAAETALRMFL